MSEERLNLIKENVYARCSIANITGIGMTAPDKEEVELIEEIERLNKIINEFDKWLLGEQMMIYRGSDDKSLIGLVEIKNKWLELNRIVYRK